MLSTLVNPAQIHLMVNHFPVIGIVFCIGLLTWAWFKNDVSVQKLALIVVILTSLSVIPAYISGEPAEELLEKNLNSNEFYIERHEEAAEIALWGMGALGILATVSLTLVWRKNAVPKSMLSGTLFLAVLVFILLARTAHLGGEISHPEIRQNPLPQQTASEN